MDQTGYDHARIEAFETEIGNAAVRIGEATSGFFQTCLITPMSVLWYAPEAVTTFDEIISTKIQPLGEKIRSLFQSYVGIVNTAGVDWAAKTKGTAPGLQNVPEVTMSVNNTLQESNGTQIYLAENSATTLAAGLEGKIGDAVYSVVAEVAGHLKANGAFLGHGQDEAIEAVAENVRTCIKSAVAEVTTYLGDVIPKYAKEYSEAAERIKGSMHFAG